MLNVDNDLTIKILQDLVRIPSVNPELVPGAAGEAEVANYVCDLMQSWGIESFNRELAPGRHNAIGVMRGSGGGRTLLFNGHFDTVSVAGMAEPFSGAVREGKLYGRGASDMKGSLAATLAATHAIIHSGARLRGDVVFTYVADEEYASIGTEGVVEDIRSGLLPSPAGALNTESTGLRVGIGHKGFCWVDVATMGVAAHGSRPDLGVDAIAQMGKVLVELIALQSRLADGPKHPLLGAGSVHASLIEGGRELSSYPDLCKLRIERRTIPPESGQHVAIEMGSLLERLAHADPSFQATSRVAFVRNPWVADLQSDVANDLRRAVETVTGKPAETMTQSGWLDTALLGDAGIPAIVFGPAGGGAHATDEWVDLASLHTCAGVYAALMQSFCG